jgi:uncharacterized DUF497 family protein
LNALQLYFKNIQMPHNNRMRSDLAYGQAADKKHGIDFEQAQMLWEDPNLLEVRARSDSEPGSLIVARLKDHYWSAVVTYRDDEVRIILVRRSRAAELELVERHRRDIRTSRVEAGSRLPR